MNGNQKSQFFISEIAKRCKEANVKIEVGERFVKIYFPTQEKETKVLAFPISAREEQFLEGFLQVPFEKFQSISNYRAIWSRELGYIEAGLEGSPFGFDAYLLRDYFRSRSRDASEADELPRHLITSNNERFQGVKVTIGLATDAFSRIGTTLCDAKIVGTQEWRNLRSRWRVPGTRGMEERRSLTIAIEGVDLKNSKYAQGVLESIANPILIQLDDLGISLHLADDAVSRRKVYSSWKDKLSIEFPEYQIESEPASLYWYANESREMPLLQYLAYYQVLEFFFPRYAEKQTFSLIKRMLKDPSFRNNIDASITRLISAIKPYVGRGGYPDERASLKATLEHCLSSEEIKDFIRANEEMNKFFTTREEWKVVASQNIFNENPKAEQTILYSTALRIYEIRCKIVHTKSSDLDNQNELLLPFSKEAQKLQYDIQLVKFVARKVLVASGKPLSL